MAKVRDLIFFVHGLGGDPVKTWRQFPHLIKTDDSFKSEIEIFSYRYPTSILNVPFMKRAPKIQDVSMGIKTELEVRLNEYDRVIFVCHSLGGLVTRKFILDNSDELERLKIEGVILYAVPNNGATLAKVGKYVSWKNNQLKQLCDNSDFVEFLNDDWIKKDIQKMLPVHFVIAGQDALVSAHSAKAFWGNKGISYIPNCDHTGVVKPDSRDHLSYKVLKNFYLSLGDTLSSKSRYLTKQIRDFGTFCIPSISIPLDIKDAWVPLKTINSREKVVFEEESIDAFIEQYHRGDSTIDDYNTSHLEALEIFNYHDYNIVVGIPGAGKSTYLKRLVYDLAEKDEISIFLKLPQLIKSINEGKSFHSSLEIALKEQNLSVEIDVTDILDKAKYLLLDGLDECGTQIEKVSMELLKYLRERKGLKVVVTTRPLGVREYLFHDWHHYVIDNLSKSDINSFSEKLFEKLSKGDEDLKQKRVNYFNNLIKSNYGVRVAARNPLLLCFVVLATFYRKKIGIYKSELFRALLELSFDSTPDRTLGTSIKYTKKELLNVLYVLGEVLTKDVIKKEDELIEEAFALLKVGAFSSDSKKEGIVEVALLYWKNKGLLDSYRSGFDEYVTFVHLSIAEYCSSKYMESLDDYILGATLVDKLLIPKFFQSILFMGRTEKINTCFEIILQKLESCTINEKVYITFLCLELLAETESIENNLVGKVLIEVKVIFDLDLDVLSEKLFLLLTSINSCYLDKVNELLKEIPNENELAQMGKCLVNTSHGLKISEKQIKDDFYISCFCISISAFDEQFKYRSDFYNFKKELLLGLTRYHLVDGNYEILKKASYSNLSWGITTALGELFDEFGQKSIYDEIYNKEIKDNFKDLFNFSKEYDDYKKSDLVYLYLLDEILDDMGAKAIEDDKELFQLRKISCCLNLADSPAYEGKSLHKLSKSQLQSVKEILKAMVYCVDIDIHKLRGNIVKQREKYNTSEGIERYSFDHVVSHVKIEADYKKMENVELNDEFIVRAINSPLSYVRFTAANIFSSRSIGNTSLKEIFKNEVNSFTFGLDYSFQLIPDLFSEEEGFDIAYTLIKSGLTPDSSYIYKKLHLFNVNIPTDSRLREVLTEGLFSQHQNVAIEAAGYFCEVVPNDYFLRELQKSYEYWIVNETPYPVNGGVIHDTPRVNILKILLTTNEYTLYELLNFASQKWSAFFDIVLPEISKRLSEDEGTFVSLINGFKRDMISQKLLIKVLENNPLQLKRNTDQLRKMWDSENEKMRVVYIRCLRFGSLEYKEATSLLENILKDKSYTPTLREEAYNTYCVLQEVVKL